MHKTTANITYYVNDTPFCGECRFCLKHRSGATCLVNNEILTITTQGPLKTKRCLANVPITYEEEPVMDANVLLREALKRYTKLVNGYIKAGYVYDIADRMAKEALKKEGFKL